MTVQSRLLLLFRFFWCVVYWHGHTSRLLSAARMTVCTGSRWVCWCIVRLTFLLFSQQGAYETARTLVQYRRLLSISMGWRSRARFALSVGYSFSFSPFHASHKLLLQSSCFGKHCLYLLLWHRSMRFDHVSKIRVLANQDALRHLSGRLWFHRLEAAMEVPFLHRCIPGGQGLLRFSDVVVTDNN